MSLAQAGGGRTFRVDALALVALSLPLVVVGSTADAAHWVTGLLPLWPQAVIGLLAGYGMVVWLKRLWMAGAAIVATASAAAVLVGLPHLGAPVAGMALVLVWLAWAAGGSTALIAFGARQHARWMFVPGLLALLGMLANLPASYEMRLLVFLALTGGAVAVFKNDGSWRVRPNRLGAAAAGIFMAVLATAVASVAPAPSASLFPDLIEAVSDRWSALVSQQTTLFTDVPNRREIPALRLAETLPMTRPIPLNDAPMMTVRASEPQRWRLGAYETYSSRGWSRSVAVPSADAAAGPVGQEDDHREEARILVRTSAIFDQVVTPGLPISASLDIVEERSAQVTYRLTASGNSPFIPSDLSAIRRIVISDPASDAAEQALDAAGAEVVTVEREAVVVRRKDDEQPSLALRFAEGLIPPRTFESVGSVSTATPSDLRQASAEYPLPIADRYLQLPPDFPASVRHLALTVTAEADNPYDRAKAIESHLRGLRYSTEIAPPPVGRDPVDWFLTESQVGFCTYFASSMITMLRSLGVPARLAVGFAPGDFNDEDQAWQVVGGNYHAWPEVYFSDFGWVDFEPTPAGIQRSLSLLRSASSADVAPIQVEGNLDTDCDSGEGPCVDLTFEEDLAGGRVDGGITRPERGFTLAPYWPAGLGLLGFLALGAVAYLYAVGVASRSRLLLSALARLTGEPSPARPTPHEHAISLARRLPGNAQHLAALASAFDVARFSREKRLGRQSTHALWAAYRAWPLMALALARHRVRLSRRHT